MQRLLAFSPVGDMRHEPHFRCVWFRHKSLSNYDVSGLYPKNVGASVCARLTRRFSPSPSFPHLT